MWCFQIQPGHASLVESQEHCLKRYAIYNHISIAIAIYNTYFTYNGLEVKSTVGLGVWVDCDSCSTTWPTCRSLEG